MAEVDQRRYVRHPIRVPLVVRPAGATPAFLSQVGDLSEGGVSFASRAPLAVGSRVEVDIPVRSTLFTLHGSVVTCLEQPEDGAVAFRIGLAFTEAAASFRLKLAEQVLRINELRLELSRERGAEVSSSEAARVWVERYAETFADLFQDPSSPMAVGDPT